MLAAFFSLVVLVSRTSMLDGLSVDVPGTPAAKVTIRSAGPQPGDDSSAGATTIEIPVLAAASPLLASPGLVAVRDRGGVGSSLRTGIGAGPAGAVGSSAGTAPSSDPVPQGPGSDPPTGGPEPPSPSDPTPPAPDGSPPPAAPAPPAPPATPPGLAKKPGGLPPGLAKKPGGLPPGQAKKG